MKWNIPMHRMKTIFSECCVFGKASPMPLQRSIKSLNWIPSWWDWSEVDALKRSMEITGVIPVEKAKQLLFFNESKRLPVWMKIRESLCDKTFAISCRRVNPEDITTAIIAYIKTDKCLTYMWVSLEKSLPFSYRPDSLFCHVPCRKPDSGHDGRWTLHDGIWCRLREQIG